MAVLSVQNLQKTYNKNNVVKDISIKVESGEIVGLLGPNGAGKTTSFYMIVGLVAADHGQIKIDQRDLTRMPIHLRSRLGISYLPQEPSIFRKLNVSQNILSIIELNEKSKIKQQEKLDLLLNELNIEHIRQNTAISLSGGERRRVEIARCLATNPKFILLDEPFAGIDPIAVYEVQKIVRRLRQRGLGILITDHNVRETLKMVDRAYLIHQGRVILEGDAEKLVEDPKAREIYLGPEFNI